MNPEIRALRDRIQKAERTALVTPDDAARALAQQEARQARWELGARLLRELYAAAAIQITSRTDDGQYRHRPA